MTTIAAAPIVVPSGVLVIFSDGTVGPVASGSIGVPTADRAAAGFTAITDEIVAVDSVLADAVIPLALRVNPLVPSALVIRSSDASPLVVTEDGSGGFAGDVGAGPNAIGLSTGIGTVTFGSAAAGPIVASYQQLGTSRGTIFTLIDADGVPLGRGTLTLSTGAAVVIDVASNELDPVEYETVDIIVDPDPTAPSLQLTDTNLDLATLELIAAQIEQCSALWQHEVTFAGRNVPWIRRAALLRIDDLHDEQGDVLEIPPLLVHNCDIDVGVISTTRNGKALAWTLPGLTIPGDEANASAATGDAQTFTDRGVWQPHTTYAEFDAVRGGPTLVHLWFVAILQDRGGAWVFPALSGATNPLAPTGQLPALAEGSWIPDRDIRAWWGVSEILTLTGSVSGQALVVHDREGAAHYLTYYPAAGTWTDTPVPPGM